MRSRAAFKIMTRRHKHPILPCCTYLGVTVRLVETVHHLPQFLKLLRPGYGLADHDH
jgi:hypothetical protein